MMDVIYHHEHLQRGMLFRHFLEAYWRAPGPIPPDNQVIGTVRAVVNHGRWVIECPTPECKSAVVAPQTDDMYACVTCGSGWYRIIYPPPDQKRAIEAVLLRREKGRGQLSPTRNWLTTESVRDLLDENAAHGIRE